MQKNIPMKMYPSKELLLEDVAKRFLPLLIETKKVITIGNQDQEWKMTDYYCPNCGDDAVWQECIPSDHENVKQVCVSCNALFQLSETPDHSEAAKNIVQKLLNDYQ